MYEIVSKLGSGAFGEVFKAKNKHTNEFVAVKKYSLKMIKENQDLNTTLMINCIKNEIKTMRVVSRDIEAINVINLHEVYETGDLVYLVMDLIDGGDLLDFLDTHSSKHSLNDEDILVIMKQLTHGLKHLADSNIVHRDIKPENILVTGDDIKLADFGCCKGVFAEPPYTEYISTRWYRPPECL